MNGDYSPEEIPALATKLGKATIEYNEDEEDEGGIATIKKRKYVRKN
jgi:hypothetical protein